jgi:hypothetical protein
VTAAQRLANLGADEGDEVVVGMVVDDLLSLCDVEVPAW